MSYSKSINKYAKIEGSLFRKNFRRKPIHTMAYFLGCIAYIHRNPAHHGFTMDWKDWKWSSYGRILLPNITHLNKNTTLDAYGSVNDFIVYHDEYDKYKKDEAHWAIENEDEV